MNIETLQKRVFLYLFFASFLMFLTSMISFAFIPFDLQVPTKWDGSGRPTQFVSAGIALLMMPVLSFVVAVFVRKVIGWIPMEEKPHAIAPWFVGFAALLLMVFHGAIVWGAFARL